MTQGDGASLASEAYEAGIRAAPVAGSGGALLFGVSLNEMVAITAIIYTVFQTIVLAHSVYNKWKEKKNGSK